MTEDSLRTRDDIQFAHDTLASLVLDQNLFDLVVPEEHKAEVLAALDALCWVLCHEHNDKFDQLLKGVRGLLMRLGCEMVRAPEMIYPTKKGTKKDVPH